VFGGILFFCFFLSFRDRILDGSRCLKKVVSRARHGKGGIAHYCTLLCDIPLPAPFIAYNIAQYIFPATPFIAIKYWQYFVRAKVRHIPLLRGN